MKPLDTAARCIAKSSLLALLCFLSGCVAIDSRVDAIAVKRFPGDGTTVTFANRPTYASKQGFFEAPSDFADVVGMYAHRGRPRADQITLRLQDGVGLTVRLIKDGKVLFEKTYRAGEEMQITQAGGILLSPKHDLHSGGGSALIYEKKQIALHIDNDENLVVVESSDALGVFLIVPVPGHTRLVSIFPRVK